MEWISVNDRFPENLKVVLVYGETSPLSSAIYNGYSVAWRHADGWYGGDSFNITHWAELPEPPQTDF